MKIKIFYLENMDAERFERDWDWCYARGVNTHWVYMKYDCKVFSRGVIRYPLGYMEHKLCNYQYDQIWEMSYMETSYIHVY